MDRRAPIRTLLALATIFAFAQPSAAFAATAPDDWQLPSVTITDRGISPDTAATGGGHAFVLESTAEASVVVEFSLRDGQRIACASRGRTPRLGQVFALSERSPLVCHGMPGRYEFTAQVRVRLASGAVQMKRSAGSIEIS